MWTCRASKRHAFSLVEVVVALGILVFGILGVLELFTSNRTVARQALLRSRAMAEAREVTQSWRAAGPEALAKIFLADKSTTPTEVLIPKSPAPLQGEVGAWQARITPVSGHPDLVQVEIAVGWDEATASPLAGRPGNTVQLVEWFPLRAPAPAAPPAASP